MNSPKNSVDTNEKNDKMDMETFLNRLSEIIETKIDTAIDKR